MANDNKNTHDLAAEIDEDTSELEILPAAIAEDPTFDYESESDAVTYSFESLDAREQHKSLATLQAELRERDEHINRLEYDVEQLRARRTGLETELKAREELTENVTSELDQARQKLVEVRERLERRDGKIASLETHLGSVESSLGEARRAAESSQARITDLDARYGEAETRIEALTRELERAQSERQQALDGERSQGRLLAELEERHTESRSLLETLREYIEGRKQQWEEQEVLLRAKDNLLEEQHRKILRYTQESKQATERLRDEQAARQGLETGTTSLRQENERLRQELDALKRQMADADAPLAAEQQKTALLTARLDETRQSLEQERADREMAAAALGAREEELATARAELASRHREFEAQRDELQEKLARLRQSNDGLQQAASAREESMALQLAEIDSLAAQLAEITSEYEQERFERQSMEAQGNTLEEKAARLATRIVELEESVAASKPLHEDNARLSGMLVSNNAEARGLREQVAKTEAYADALRRKLQGRAEEIEAAAAAQRSMQATLDQALAQIHELRDQVEAERRANVALSEQRQADREVFDEQLRQVRSELEAAEEAIAENQTVNEQLTSDLIETTGFRIALESQLAQADDDYQKDVKDLNRQLKRLRQQLEDYERKVSNKDAAISVLLTELAHKPQPAASEVEADAVIHRLGTRKQAGADDKPAHDRDRTTRLLVGTIEGQEVRFPLFKNKLTIGRTAHNDIQLKQQYISRRHAVVVCDNDNTRIVDWGSKNGIYVNGIRVSEKILKNGDQLTVGTAEFRFEERPKR